MPCRAQLAILPAASAAIAGGSLRVIAPLYTDVVATVRLSGLSGADEAALSATASAANPLRAALAAVFCPSDSCAACCTSAPAAAQDGQACSVGELQESGPSPADALALAFEMRVGGSARA